ncbi:AraC family transcriptional regulator [Sphingobacterium humi]|uniref:Helix-turn-helix domain-containing protein n=1 Tax=Sphingobacterium humi TaxID=1796905 RepID=A0A6N8L3W8_9SPHI|nr:helix-turn-helix domain-containing protein [Sphingobacterium humi]MVZ62472.1 helix-turn-helix domain-containing protein [Sphingobacterium humi]
MKQAIHTIERNTNAYAGIEISKLDTSKEEAFSVHREDYFSLIYLLKGSGTVVIESEKIAITSPSIIIVSPLQTHYVEEISYCKGYNIDIENFLIPNVIICKLQSLNPTQQVITLDYKQIDKLFRIADLLFEQFENKGKAYTKEIIVHLSTALLFQSIANLPVQHIGKNDNVKTQGKIISDSFKVLLSKTLKVQSPAFYAKKLHISVSHLNDMVKSYTGKTSSFWIHYFIIIEAKRLLYHTNLTIKEISFELGFNEASYFTRLFKNTTGVSPMNFRNQFCDMS